MPADLAASEFPSSAQRLGEYESHVYYSPHQTIGGPLFQSLRRFYWPDQLWISHVTSFVPGRTSERCLRGPSVKACYRQRTTRNGRIGAESTPPLPGHERKCRQRNVCTPLSSVVSKSCHDIAPTASFVSARSPPCSPSSHGPPAPPGDKVHKGLFVQRLKQLSGPRRRQKKTTQTNKEPRRTRHATSASRFENVWFPFLSLSCLTGTPPKPCPLPR
ncbi:hypothetical protein BDU57DRAFT_514618 [Ampelomyces quisqualis]|uniref:Uncharacterized protein n=1 Tax=Ampelomyces quisqualis TaxID=50730 RepID=A0A6A5QTE1_AMPQU|nr:hypothetical protein BDU57DRAFT_514618 [Ampelomyces quisqualis]